MYRERERLLREIGRAKENLKQSDHCTEHELKLVLNLQREKKNERCKNRI